MLQDATQLSLPLLSPTRSARLTSFSLTRNFPTHCGVQFMVRTNLAKSFVAVVSGNALYFLIFLPILPPAARHRPFRLDLGLLIDVWTCFACYGIVEIISRFTRNRRGD
jgi:hypothetical protein